MRASLLITARQIQRRSTSTYTTVTTRWKTIPATTTPTTTTTRSESSNDNQALRTTLATSARIQLSQQAIQKLEQINRDTDKVEYLRVAVDSGGCHGYQYAFQITGQPEPDDLHFVAGPRATVLVDAISYPFLADAQIDYVDELIGSAFKIGANPNASSECGCKISFQAKFTLHATKVHSPFYQDSTKVMNSVQAYEAQLLADDLPLRISSVASHADRLLVATTSGTLLVFGQRQERAVDRLVDRLVLLETHKSVSPKSIQQMEALPELDMLLVRSGTIFSERRVAAFHALLVDARVSIHDLTPGRGFVRRSTLGKTRGATGFAVCTSPEFTNRVPQSGPALPEEEGSDVTSSLSSANQELNSITETSESAPLSMVPEVVRSSSSSSSGDPEEVQVPVMATRVAVSLRNKKYLLVYTWIDQRFVDCKQVRVPATALSLAWASGCQLCVATKKMYHLLNVVDGTRLDLFPVTRNAVPTGTGTFGRAAASSTAPPGVPLAISLRRHDQVLLLQDKMGICIGSDGSPMLKSGILWSHIPQTTVCHFPYLVSAFTPSSPTSTVSFAEAAPSFRRGSSTSSLPTHSTATGAVSIEIRNMLAPSICQQLHLAGSQFFLEATSQGRGSLYVASEQAIWVLKPLPFQQQLDDLVAKKYFPEALALLEQMESLAEEEKNLERKRIRTVYAIHLFIDKLDFAESLALLQQVDADPLEVISALYPFLSSNNAARLPRELSKASSTTSLWSSSPLPASTRSPTLAPHRIESPLGMGVALGAYPELSDQQIHRALQELIRFLTERRSLLLRNRSQLAMRQPPPRDGERTIANLEMDLTVVDTNLLNAYLKGNEALAGSLLRVQNFCQVEEAERLLLRHKKWSELIDLYHGKGLHRQALTFLSKYLKVPSHPVGGLQPSIGYLQKLGREHVEVVLEFSKELLEMQPEEALRIFVDHQRDREQAEQGFPPEVILGHLERYAPSVVLAYLEHLVFVQHEKTPDLHDRLILGYFKKVMQSKEILKSGGEALRLSEEQGERGEWRRKLEQAIRESSYFRAERVLPYFPEMGLFEERAAVLGKLGQHAQALTIYVRRLQDVSLAERYCNEQWKMRGDGKLYITLLRVLLEPSKATTTGPPLSHPVLLQDAVRMMNRYGDRMDPRKALAILPPTVPLSLLEAYFTRTLESLTRQLYHGKVQRNLRKTELMQTKEQYVLRKLPWVRVEENTVCRACGKRIGAGSAFVYVNAGSGSTGVKGAVQMDVGIDSYMLHLGCRGRGGKELQ